MADVITAKNITSGPAVDVPIDQLSVPDAIIPASSQVILTDWNTVDEITVDEQLREHIGNDLIILIVDGVELTKPQSISVITPVVSEESTPFLVLKGTAGTINAGQVVRITGYDGTNEVTTVELADASAAATMPAVGIAEEEITDSTAGSMVTLGQLVGQDTSMFSVGDELYVSETPGALTTTKPTGTALIQKIAEVARSDATGGILQVFATGRSNDLPNIPQTKFWLGDASGVPQPTTIEDLTADGSPDGAADYVMTWDDSASLHKKVLLDNIGGGGGGVFGSEHYYNENLPEQGTTSSSFIQGLRLSTASIPAGDYFIGWSGECRQDNSSFGVRVRIRLDAGGSPTDLMDVDWGHLDAGKWNPFSGFAEYTLTAAAHTVDIDFASEAVTKNVRVRNLRLVFWRAS